MSDMVQSNRLRLHALSSSAKEINVDVNKYKVKSYKHFDNKISIEKVIDNITNPNWIVHHAFFPFIHFQIKFFKYSRFECNKKKKIRDIHYASHIDSYIYKYYGDLLNDKYNAIADKYNIDDVATAYRNNRRGKSNIHFAKEVIDFISRQEKAFIFVADFTKFFDQLEHGYLKKQIQAVLEVQKLPDDYYSIFKHITKFSWVDKEKIELVLKKKYKNKNKIKKATKFRYFNEQEFRKFRSSDKKNIQTNKKGYGIPQGAGLSSVCSNIYLLDFDRNINEYVSKNNGIYRRYCDDLIIIIPFRGGIEEYDYNSHIEFIDKIKNEIPKLEIHPEKTCTYFYSNNQILDESLCNSHLDYLGFSFDGMNVKIREKSLFKFYNRAYKKVKKCNENTKKHGKKSNYRDLYKKYTHLGKYENGYGNFISYALRAQKVFNKDTLTNNLMENQIKNHWKYINNRLKK